MEIIDNGQFDSLAKITLESEIHSASVLHSKQKTSTLVCFICGRRLRNRTRFQKHLAAHTEGTGFQCKSCTEYFPTQNHLSIHIKRTHRDDCSFTCDHCRMNFKQRGEITKHIVSHFDGKMYKCSMCTKCFRSKMSLDNHKKSHAGIKSHICEICKQKFAYPESLKRHMRIHTGETPHVCEFCGESFSLCSYLNYHKRKMHTGERIKCPICFKTYMEKYDMIRHIKRNHNNEKPINCDICGYSFSRIQDLKRHMPVHRDGKLDKCDRCGLTFKRKSELNKHIRFVHVGTQPCICDFCGFKCPFVSHMAKHMMSHFGIQPYSCKSCGINFSDMKTLERHMKIHSESIFSEDKPPFKCDKCSRIFARKIDWIAHQKSHNGVPTLLTCDVCDYKCKQLSGLKRHKLTHIASKDVACEICDEMVDKTQLLKHIRILHDGITPLSCELCDWQSYTLAGLRKHAKSHIIRKK